MQLSEGPEIPIERTRDVREVEVEQRDDFHGVRIKEHVLEIKIAVHEGLAGCCEGRQE